LKIPPPQGISANYTWEKKYYNWEEKRECERKRRNEANWVKQL
jgi:hypothetical protein